MRKKIAAFALTLAMLALPALAQAETLHGFYIGGHAGLNFKLDRNFDVVGVSLPWNIPIDSKLGWGAGFSFGYGLTGTQNWFAYPRIELEMTWRRNNGHTGGSVFSPNEGLDHKLTSMAAMANLLLDFDLGGKVYPYLGVGFGAATAWLNVDVPAGFVDPVTDTAIPTDIFDIQDTAFAYQAKAGLGFIASEHVHLFAEYTYIGSLAFEQNSKEMGGMSDHSLMVGLRYAFGKSQSTPKPIPADVVQVPAEPVLVNSFMVFFDHDSSRLDNAANATIAQAVAEFHNTGSTRIDVTGHTDTTGNAQYNLALSQRRAQAVADALAALGVPGSAVGIYGVGENDQLVPTGDNVHERQNRRVFIYLYK